MRRQFVTHPSFQRSFTLSFLLGVLLIFVIIGGTTIFSLYWLGNDPMVSETQRQILRGNAREFATYVAYLTFFALLVMGWIGFYLSYKFVGPLFRLEVWLKDRLNNKNADPIVLRPGDELEPISVILNRLVKRNGL